MQREKAMQEPSLTAEDSKNMKQLQSWISDKKLTIVRSKDGTKHTTI
jgi:hypothetical protein